MQEKLKEYHEIITEAWKYLKCVIEKYNGIDIDNVDWSEIIEKGENIVKRHDKNKFAIDIVLACVEEFERDKKNEKRPD